jgi:hypothetical protein
VPVVMTVAPAIELLVALRSGTPYRGSARGIQQAELDTNGIGHLAHDAAECVYFANEVTLSHAAHGRIAAHLGNQVHVHGDEGGLEPKACRGHGRLATCVACTDHGHIVLF